MKLGSVICLVFTSLRLASYGQGTFIYDQQSASEDSSTTFGEGGQTIQNNQPFGQSFTPMMNEVGFIRLALEDWSPGNGQGSELHVQLLATAITGPVLATSSVVDLPDAFGTGPSFGFGNFVNFFFAPAVALTPGMTYYFRPILESGDDVYVIDSVRIYPGGSQFSKGSAVPPFDFWFREGIYVAPEPSPVWLLLLGSVVFGFRIRRQGRHVKRFLET